MLEYLYILKPTRLAMLSEGPTDEESGILSLHALYVEDLAKRGVVELAGRTLNDDETTFGLVVFSAKNKEAAQQIMRDDPAVQHGVMLATLFPYRIAFRSS